MIVWKVENYRKAVTCYKPERVFDVIIDDFDRPIEDALSAEGWCELAYVGEVYQDNGITITVEEE